MCFMCVYVYVSVKIIELLEILRVFVPTTLPHPTNMELIWRCRILILLTLFSILFNDIIRFGNNVIGVQTTNPNEGTTAKQSNKFQQDKNSQTIDIIEDTDLTELSPDTSGHQEKRDSLKLRITNAMKDSCLPKMLCEIAAKPDYLLTEKEKDLLYLVRSSSLSLTYNGSPSKWHFASHMGELFRYTGDELTGPIGCANLWPNCPISSKTLLKLSYKIKL